MADRPKKYYKTVEKVTCLPVVKKNGDVLSFASGEMMDGTGITAFIRGGAVKLEFQQVREGSPWPGQNIDGSWPPKKA